ncbi:LOW QUALITY PROTEIN: cilia- and flagella-associated protein 300 [Salvelinus sp. IW2-2015]|uniref:LOW QUALITY PROTEIN: cilia- and flagella-associated protein 300 n=1 Tax=Salvelinus sp. IW2-2015 TaxID=2691554 RepID=UPI0038D4001C
MACKNSPFETKFSFNLLPTKTFSFLRDKSTLQLLMKWSMLGRISAQAFSFDQTFHPYNSHDFTLSFFRDPCVLTNLRKMEAGAWVTLGMSCHLCHLYPVSNPKACDPPEWSHVVRQFFFANCLIHGVSVWYSRGECRCRRAVWRCLNPLYSSGIITPSAHITKCVHDTYPDYDLLRQGCIRCVLPSQRKKRNSRSPKTS